MARQNPYDGRLLALLGGRQMEAGEFATAADTLAHSIAAGEKTEPVWLTFASAKAATGDPTGLGYVRMGEHEINTPGIAAALVRCQMLGSKPAPVALAAAICPRGPEPLVDAYTRGSFLNGPVAWWGRHHPEQSGFATRQDWAKQQPEDAQVQRLWGLALLQNRRLPEAQAVLAQAVALAPNSPAAHLALAEALEQQGPAAQASLEYVACLKLRPDWLPALLGLGRTLITEQLPVTGAAVYAEAARIAPDSVDAWIGEGEADVSAQQGYGGAINAFQAAARLAPSRTDFFPYYSDALRAQGRWQEAEYILRRRLAANPADAFSHYKLGSLLLSYNATPERAAEAESQTREALRLAPQTWLTEQQLAEALLRRGRPQEAANWLQQALTGNPYNAKALLDLAQADRQMGLSVQADQAFRQATTVSRIESEIDVVKTHATADPSNIGYHLQLADLYQRSGQPDKAIQERQVAGILRAQPSLRSQGIQTLPSIVNGVLPRQ